MVTYCVDQIAAMMDDCECLRWKLAGTRIHVRASSAWRLGPAAAALVYVPKNLGTWGPRRGYGVCGMNVLGQQLCLRCTNTVGVH